MVRDVARPAGIPTAILPPRGAPGAGKGRIRATPGSHTAVLSRVAVLLLVAFHAWLFWDRFFDGRFFEPAVASRWIAGALLTAALLWFRRTGLPLLWGRKAVVVWLLIVLLHAHAVWSPSHAEVTPGGVDTVAAFVLQAASATTLIGVGLALLCLLARALTARVPAASWFAAHAIPAGRPGCGHLLLLAPRPPPAI